MAIHVSASFSHPEIHRLSERSNVNGHYRHLSGTLKGGELPRNAEELLVSCPGG
jgi:hypothetical protein